MSIRPAGVLLAILALASLSALPAALGGPTLPVVPAPVGEWRFDADDHGQPSAGLTRDRSAFAHHGGVWGPTLTAGHRDEAYQFPGNGNYVHLGGAATLNVLGDWSFAAWVKPTDTGIHFVVDKWAPGEDLASNRAYNVLLEGGRITYRHEHGAGVNVDITTGGAYVPASAWTHLVVVRDATEKTISFYTNGALREKIGYLQNPDGGEGTVAWLGHEDYQEAYDFRGVMDEAIMFDEALTPLQVAALHLST